jgi:hypothetical protein
VVDLHGARGDDRGRGQAGNRLRGDRAHAGRQRAARGGGAGARGGAARRRPGGRAAARARGRAEVRQHELLEDEQRADREDGGKRPVGLLELLAERRAAIALANVAAHGRGRALEALGHLAELLPNFGTRELARFRGLGQRDARAHEQRLDARDGRLHRLRDLLVRERVDLTQEQRRPLRLRQLLDVLHEEPELLAPVHLVRGRRAAVGEVDVHRVHADRGGAPQVVERPVARDAVEPGADVQRALIGEHRVEGRGEDVLEDVLGVLARPQHVPAERKEARLVAAHQGFVGGLVAASGQRDQAVVGLQPQQRRRSAEPVGPDMLESSGFHA